MRKRKKTLMTSYERYVSEVESDTITVQYVVDNEGNLHDLSGNIQNKLDSIDKSRRYWEQKLRENPNDIKAQRFYYKFDHLYGQILIFAENTKLVEHE